MNKKVRINYTSSQFAHTPGLYKWTMGIQSSDIQKETRDVAARLYMLCDLLPGLTGVELKAIAEGELSPEIDEDKRTVSFVVTRPVPYNAAVSERLIQMEAYCPHCLKDYDRGHHTCDCPTEDDCDECGGMGHTIGFEGPKEIKYPCETCEEGAA